MRQLEQEGRHLYDSDEWDALTEAEQSRAELGLHVNWVENIDSVSMSAQNLRNSAQDDSVRTSTV